MKVEVWYAVDEDEGQYLSIRQYCTVLLINQLFL